MILVAFAYRYRPSPWLQVAAQGMVLTAVAPVTGAAVIAWQGKMPPPTPAAASHPPAGTARGPDHVPLIQGDKPAPGSHGLQPVGVDRSSSSLCRRVANAGVAGILMAHTANLGVPCDEREHLPAPGILSWLAIFVFGALFLGNRAFANRPLRSV